MLYMKSTQQWTRLRIFVLGINKEKNTRNKNIIWSTRKTFIKNTNSAMLQHESNNKTAYVSI